MSEHRYKIGQSVQLTVARFDRSDLEAVYMVTQLLPAERGGFQYRIKNAAEPHERVVEESDLNPIAR